MSNPIRITPENSTLYHFDNVDYDHVFHTEDGENGVNIYEFTAPDLIRGMRESGLFADLSLGNIEDNPDEIDHICQAMSKFVLARTTTMSDSPDLLDEYAQWKLDNMEEE